MRIDSYSNMPKDASIDSTAAFIREGYTFILNRCLRYDTDVFQTRLGCKKIVCLSGEDAARLFYNDEFFKRNGVAPKVLQKSFMGENGIQNADGEEHRFRKSQLVSLMSAENLQEICDICRDTWAKYGKMWVDKESIVLYREAQKIICETALKWSGIPYNESENEDISKDFIWLVDALGDIGVRNFKGLLARKRLETRLQAAILQVRNQSINPPENSALYVLSWYKNSDGSLIPVDIAAVDLINIIRPTVAISIFIMFGALALYDNPECIRKIKSNEEGYLNAFVQEVRRFYPLAPFAGAKAAEDFSYKQFNFKKDDLVLLDIYGANHNPKYWEEPEKFMPERFINKQINEFDFIPHGGGDVKLTHRCAGEELTIRLMRESFDFIVNSMSYTVPNQDLSYKLCRIPSVVESGFIIENIKII